MQHLYSLLLICLVLAFEIRAIDVGMRAGRKLQRGERMLQTSEEEASGSAVAPEDTEYRTDQTFYSSEDLESFLKEANLTSVSDFRCEQVRVATPSAPVGGSQRCQVTHNRKLQLPRDRLIAVVVAPTARVCCELCRAIRECYSWWRRYSDGHCHLNKTFARGVYSSNAAGGHL